MKIDRLTAKRLGNENFYGGKFWKDPQGEYIIYYKGKVAAYVCDERLLVKPVDAAKRFIPDIKSVLTFLL